MLKSFLSVFLQSSCPLCDRSTSHLVCQDCYHQLKAYQSPYPQQFWQPPTPLFCWGHYEGALKRALTTLKYNHHPQLAEELGIWLGETWLKLKVVSPQQNYAVLPIPLHPNRFKERGFNQAEWIAKGFCRVTHTPLYAKGLQRTKDTIKLFDLGAVERQNVIKNSFRLGQDFQKGNPSLPLLIVDDIYTTGASAKEAIRVLKNHHCTILGIAVIATPRPSSFR